MRHEVPAEIGRAFLLGGQGLLADPTERVTPSRLLRRIEAMGFVQVDSINVVARAHHLTLASRFDGYRPEQLTRLLESSRTLFEHWTHDAAVIPTEWFPHWHHRFARDGARVRANRWWMTRIGEQPEVVLAKVIGRVQRRGEVSASDCEGSRKRTEPAGWWGWSPEKAALEYLWRTGRLAVARRVNFEKVYDLTERVFPAHAALPPPSESEHLDWACRLALDRLGLATPGELAAFLGAITPVQARAWCAAGLKAGELVELELRPEDRSAARTVLGWHDWRDRADRLPTAPSRTRLLSPFDPIVRDRKRSERLFGFEYRFEAYTPAGKRRFGYYVLPILKRDRLVGRIDLKLHRDRGALEARGLWWERETRSEHAGLDEALRRLADQLGAETVELSAARTRRR